MHIVDICVGQPRTVTAGRRDVTTAIFKLPVPGPVRLAFGNVAGDRQADLGVHGGRDKAVYLYSADYYPLWAAELGRDALEPAQFGENLTIAGGTDDVVVIGSRLRIDGTELTVMQPRIPCHKLGLRVGDEEFPQRFWAAGRLGFYARVEVEGDVDRGLAIEVIDEPGHGITLRQLYDTVVGGDAASARRLLEHLPGLDGGWQRRLRAVEKNRAG